MQKNTAAVRSHRPQMTEKTHEGGPAYKATAEQELRRSVMACFLWEKEFYESGEDISKRISTLIPQVAPHRVAHITLSARIEMKLRHAPLFIIREMARYPECRPFVVDALPKVIQRADELAEFMAMYWSEKREPIAHCVRRGLDKAIRNFNEYELAKYDRDKTVKLRDVFRMIRPKPENDAQKELWRRAVKGELATPDTWEVSLSSKEGGSKKDKWTRLVSENKLGALALLRNLRNMEQEGVDDRFIRAAILKMNVSKVLPFRFIAAARHAPRYEGELETKMFESLSGQTMEGKTCILVDVSGSMMGKLSGKSDLTRMDAACGVAMVGRQLFNTVDIFSFSNQAVQIAPRRGFALSEAIVKSQEHGGTNLGAALSTAARNQYDRIIVITDEQASDTVTYPAGLKKGYVINVASAQNGIGYGKWVHIDGFSEAVFQYMLEAEKAGL